MKSFRILSASRETFISPSRAYSERGYNGVLVQFTAKPGTAKRMMEMGTTGNAGTQSLFPYLPRTTKGWAQESKVQFKLEGQGKPYVNHGKGTINTGLGQNGGLKLFQDNIVKFEKIGDKK